jgi:hypothetical protein
MLYPVEVLPAASVVSEIASAFSLPNSWSQLPSSWKGLNTEQAKHISFYSSHPANGLSASIIRCFPPSRGYECLRSHWLHEIVTGEWALSSQHHQKKMAKKTLATTV